MKTMVVNEKMLYIHHTHLFSPTSICNVIPRPTSRLNRKPFGRVIKIKSTASKASHKNQMQLPANFALVFSFFLVSEH